jgi:hypothetical protein
MTHVNQREANRRAWRAKTWAGVWRANGFSRGTIDALLRAEIDSNRRLLGLTRKGLRDIEGIGDSRVRNVASTFMWRPAPSHATRTAGCRVARAQCTMA